MKRRIDRHSIFEWCMTAIILISIFEGMFYEITGYGFLKYVPDLFVCFLLIMIAIQYKKHVRILQNPFVLASGFLFLYGILSAMVRQVNAGAVLWDLRGTYRVIILACVCITLMSKQHLYKMMKGLTIIYWLNAILFVIQFIQGYRLDNLGGVFGFQIGVNGRNNVLFCIMLIWYIAEYLNDKISFISCMSIVLSSFALAALCELKVFFVEAVGIGGLLCILYFLIEYKAMPLGEIWKKYRNLIVGFLFSYLIALGILYMVYPLSFKQMTQMDRFVGYEATCSPYKLGRLTAYKNINEMFFKDNWLLRLFGYGFGYCVDSSNSFLAGPFYKEFYDLNYHWFVFQLNYLEGGIVGVVLYCTMLIIPGVITFAKFLKEKSMDHFSTYALSITICPIMLLLYIYNNSLRGNVAYLAFICLVAVWFSEGRD